MAVSRRAFAGASELRGLYVDEGLSLSQIGQRFGVSTQAVWNRLHHLGIERRPRPHRPKPLTERFWPKVDTSGDCWLWTAAVGSSGYGQLSSRLGQAPLRAHRVSWELAFGEIPEGMSVLHRCDTPRCVRPEHLFLGTKADNAADMSRKRRARNGAGTMLSEETARAIMGDLLRGDGGRVVARRYGTTETVVSRIKRGRGYPDLREALPYFRT